MTGSLRRVLRPVVALTAVVVFAVVGCSHQVTSPGVAATQVQPDLVCNAQLTTPVVIHGSGFTPMPSNVLKKPAALILPSVALHLSADLTGKAAKTPSATTLSGNPSGTNADHLSWQSSSQMTASIDQQLNLQSGLYDVTVTNPDGKQKADITSGLAVVPPPSISDIKPPALCDDQSDQKLVLDGKNFLKVGGQLPTVTITGQTNSNFSVTCSAGPAAAGDAGTEAGPPPSGGCTIDSVSQCTPIPGRNPQAELCQTATITIAAGTLSPGKYSVTLTNPDPAGCHSTESITLTVNPPPRVDSVAPSKVCSGGSALDITGANFQQGATAELDCCASGAPDQKTGKCSDGSSPSVTPSTSVDFTDAQHITAHFGAGVTPGDTCNVVVQNPDSCQDRPLPHQTVQGTEGPILFYVDPPVVYNGINTKITLYLTSITGNFTVTLTPSAGTNCTGAKTTTLSDAQLVAGKNNRIQATLPKGTPACEYDVSVTDGSGCSATLAKAVNVVGKLTLTLNAITPPFGQTGTLVPVQITGSGFNATPRAFLNPVNAGPTDVAVPLEGLTMIDPTKLTAVVPKNTPVGSYDLVVVNPTGEVGLLKNAYQSLSTAPPQITGLTPQSVIDQTGQSVTASGSGFDTNATVTVSCEPAAGGQPVNAPVTGTTCTATSCSFTVDATNAGQGAVCVVKITNSDGAYAQYSAFGVTNSSYNLGTPVAGTAMNVARRALLSAAVAANNASRYVYAIGGDGGNANAASPFKSVEFANVDLYGNMSAWTMNQESLGTARSFLAGATIGRYIYAIGGTDGANTLDTAERAMVLSPAEIPHVEDVDLCLSGGSTPCFNQSGLGAGLGAGTYAYRISAVIDPTDPVNLGGETLASDPIILKLPTIPNHKISVKLTWSAPVDNQGNPLSGITGYRIYRTPANGVPGKDEVLLDTVSGANTLTYIDDGSKTLGTAKPLPPGSTSAWQALPNLNVGRQGLASLAAEDPSTPGTWYVYALEGQGQQSYEYLKVTLAANERESVVGTWQNGAHNPSVDRSEFGAWLVTSQTTSLVTAPDEWVYLGAGRTSGAGGRTGVVEAAQVQAGGDLGTWDTTPANFSSDRAGYVAFAAGSGNIGTLYAFGGLSLPSNTVNNDGDSAGITTVPALSNWNNQGSAKMKSARYLHGGAIQSAFVFFVGGEGTYNGAALKSTESLAW